MRSIITAVIFLIFVSGYMWSRHSFVGDLHAPEYSVDCKPLLHIGNDIVKAIWPNDTIEFTAYYDDEFEKAEIIKIYRPFPDRRRVSMLCSHSHDTIYACVWSDVQHLNSLNYIFWDSCDTITFYSYEDFGFGTWSDIEIDNAMQIAQLALNGIPLHHSKYSEWKNCFTAYMICVSDNTFKILNKIHVSNTDNEIDINYPLD